MSRPPKPPLFPQSAVYRRNRLLDAARLVPVLGLVLFFVPAMLSGDAASTARSWMFLFGAWFALIVLAAILSRALRSPPGDD